MSWASFGNSNQPSTRESGPPTPPVRPDARVTPPETPTRQPESPSLPRPELVESLHRRQTSNSIYSLHSDSGAPRAAMGAHRSYSAGGSPWASSLMLANYTDGGSPSHVDSGHATPTRSPAHAERRQRTQSGLRANSNLAQSEAQSRVSGEENEPQQSAKRQSTRNRLTPIRSVASLLTAARTHSNTEGGKNAAGSAGQRGGQARQNGGMPSTLADKLPARLGGAKRRNTLKRRSSVRASTAQELDYKEGETEGKGKGKGKEARCNVM